LFIEHIQLETASADFDGRSPRSSSITIDNRTELSVAGILVLYKLAKL
jgi:hypothetical protein